VGLDADLFRKVNAAATRAICGAFQGGVDAPPETRKLALGLATGRFLHHILDGACPSRKRCFSCFCLEHVLTRRWLAGSSHAVMEWNAGGEKALPPPWALIDNHPTPPAGSISPKLFLYSGHDWTLMPLVSTHTIRHLLAISRFCFE
jgi:hypothetical protein